MRLTVCLYSPVEVISDLVVRGGEEKEGKEVKESREERLGRPRGLGTLRLSFQVVDDIYAQLYQR